MDRVVFFVPNLIGYVRIILVLASFYCMPDKPFLAVPCFLIGGILLDVIDGIAARHCEQCSTYGDLLDYLTDRCCRIGMAMMLCVFYDEYIFIIQLLVCLEVCGCFCRYATKKADSHFVKTRASDPIALRFFFNEPVLSLTILGEDLCLSMLYLLHFSTGPFVSVAGTSVSLWVILAWISVPFLVYRQIVICSLCMYCSFAEIAERDEAEKIQADKMK